MLPTLTTVLAGIQGEAWGLSFFKLNGGINCAFQLKSRISLKIESDCLLFLAAS